MINEIQLKIILEKGEDSYTEFKEKINKDFDKFCEEVVAFSNSNNGIIIVGVNDNGQIIGIEDVDWKRTKELLDNALINKITPPPLVKWQAMIIENKKIAIIEVEQGEAPPYDVGGIVYERYGSATRRASRESIARMYAKGGLYEPEKNRTLATWQKHLDKLYFMTVYENKYNEVLKNDEEIEKMLNTLILAKDEYLTFTGLLLFGKNIEAFLPYTILKMMAYNGTKLEENDFKEFRESSIRLDLVYQQGMDFFDRHILKIRNGKGFDAPTKFQVDRVAFEGLFINALVHRDYTIKAPIRFFIFKDRLEIHSPGSLPNSLTEESIKKGVTKARNPHINNIISKFELIPFRGLGTGVMRAIELHPKIKFIDDKKNQQFSVIMYFEE